MEDIPIVIPAYEPDDRLIKLCEELYNANIKNMIVVNDGSSKEYNYIFDEIKDKFNCIILKHQKNLGKGRGLKNAFNYILTNYNSLLGCITADSDGQHSVNDIRKIINELKNNTNDLILGCRNFNENGIPWKSKFGNKLTKIALRFFGGVKVSDTQTGLRGIPKNMMIDLLDTQGERFEFETNMLIESKDKYKIKEVNIETIYDSKENHSTHFNPIIDSIKIYKNIFKVFFKYIFASASSFLIDILLFYYLSTILKRINENSYIIIATILARVISSIYNYLVNHILVFKSSENKGITALKYFGLVIIQMSLSAVGVHFISKYLSDINVAVIKILVDISLFFISFFVQKVFVFKK